MRYLSVCSGIEAASVAWSPLGWKAVGFSETEMFPRAVLKYRFFHTPNFGDLLNYETWPIEPGTVDLLVGGTPCQPFSKAGAQQGLDDPRGNLALVYLGLARRLQPRWIVWENVPGILSCNQGRDFGTILRTMEKLGYGWAYRVLDAQHWGVPQQRRRVFIVGYFGDWRRAAAVLFERPGSGGNSSEDLGEGPFARRRTVLAGASGAWWDGGTVAATLDAVTPKRQAMPEKNRFLAVKTAAWVPCNSCDDYICRIHAKHAFECPCPAIDEWAEHGMSPYETGALRNLTPLECERLQGFPDNWTAIPFKGKRVAMDTARMKAIGNSMAVPVVRWLGRRIFAVEKEGER